MTVVVLHSQIATKFEKEVNGKWTAFFRLHIFDEK